LASAFAGMFNLAYKNLVSSKKNFFLSQDRFDVNIPVSQLKRNDHPKLMWQSENQQTIGELFIGFLRFFAKDFR
jgi:hypothetical protein